MPITLQHPEPHPTMANVSMDKLSVEGFTLSNGSNIDKPASVYVSLRPFATVTVNGQPAYISPPNQGTRDLVIPDLYAWIQQRAGLGDMVPYNALGLLMQAIGEEFARQNPGA